VNGLRPVARKTLIDGGRGNPIQGSEVQILSSRPEIGKEIRQVSDGEADLPLKFLIEGAS
jgi:hypothetical protein